MLPCASAIPALMLPCNSLLSSPGSLSCLNVQVRSVPTAVGVGRRLQAMGNELAAFGVGMQNTKKVRPQLCWWSWAALTGGHRQYMQTQAVQAGTCIISRCRQYRWAHAVYLSECSIGERRQYRQAQAVQLSEGSIGRRRQYRCVWFYGGI